MVESEHLSQTVLDVRDVLSTWDSIEFAVLFGSFAEDGDAPPSDIDLAIKFSDELSPDERFRQLCAFSGNVQSSDRPFVDVSDIERLPLDIAHDAVHGTLIYGNEHRFEAFRKCIQETFAAQRDEIRSRQRDVIDRIAKQGLHG